MKSEVVSKTIHIQYFAILREQRGEAEETLNTAAVTARDLYQELRDQYRFSLPIDRLRLAVNDEFQEWSTPLSDGDRLVFIPPVAGGSIIKEKW